mmetsp:Transcript_7982/g.22451  ORF Transcript_7982/g.22451 Transcript_7982/m.22451 type:complete len:383 (+) Transcript_7982:1-1149(+)
MPGGSGALRRDLQAAQAELLASRAEAGRRDQRIQECTGQLIETINQRSAQVRERERLELELAEARARHEEELGRQRERLEADQRRRVREHFESAERGQQTQEEEEDDGASSCAEGGVCEEAVAEQIAQAEADNRGFVKREEQRAIRVQEELLRARAEVRFALQERDSELEAANVNKQALLAQQRAAQRQDEMLMAEVRMQVSETEALQASYGGLEGKVRSLQYELNKVSYTVGLRDHEIKVKESDLQEVRQSLGSIQDEMDEANLQLSRQCVRVQQVENSLRGSRDLGEQVAQMRDMLKDSHAALSQLCGLLEEERHQREQCAQGLKQQRVRTEFLLQLLQHFRSRTQDLTPRAILGGSVGGADAGGGKEAWDPAAGPYASC